MATTKKSATIVATPALNGNQLTKIKFTYPLKKDIATDGTISIPLSSLVSLDATTIPNAEAAMRELDENNVYALYTSYEAGKPVPPMLVQQSNEGNILVGGYHRKAAMSRLVTETNGNPDMLIPVKPAHFVTAREVLNAAYVDNFSNGLGASEGSRSRYALQLMTWDAEDGYPGGKPMSYHAAARIAGVSHVAVLKMRDKLAGKAKTKKMVDSLTSPEQDAELQAHHAETPALETPTPAEPQTALNKAIKQMFTSLAQVYALNHNVNELATLFRNYITVDDATVINTIALAFQAVTMDRKFGVKPGTSK